MSTKIRRAMAVAGVGVALAAGVLAAAPAPAAASSTGVLACNGTGFTPYKAGSVRVQADASSSGCDASWRFTATLQSSRWWGWANDASVSWSGSGNRVVGAGCSGGHDFRVNVYGTNSISTINRFSNTIYLTC